MYYNLLYPIKKERILFLGIATPKFLYLIPNYQNPSGKIMGLERRIELLRVAQAYDLLVVSIVINFTFFV